MKKIILLASLFIGSLVSAQQIAVTIQGNQIEEGYTFTTNSLAGINDLGQPNKLRFSVTNNGTESIFVGAKLISMSSNAPGDGTQLCFGSLCYPNIDPNTIVPYYDELTPGSTTPSEDDHFINTHAGTDGNAVNYKIGIVRLSVVETEEGDYTVTELETLITFNYVYQPLAAITTFSALKALGLDVANTVVTNTLNVTATQNASLQLYDVTGKLIKTTGITSGDQAIDLSALNTAVYFARFTTADKKTAQIRIVKN